MAKNTGDGFRRGAVAGRTQFQRPDRLWQKRDERTGHLMSVKDDGEPFKGVAREPDGRDTPNAGAPRPGVASLLRSARVTPFDHEGLR